MNEQDLNNLINILSINTDGFVKMGGAKVNNVGVELKPLHCNRIEAIELYTVAELHSYYNSYPYEAVDEMWETNVYPLNFAARINGKVRFESAELIDIPIKEEVFKLLEEVINGNHYCAKG